MKLIDVLRDARALIARPEHWTRHAFARNADLGDQAAHALFAALPEDHRIDSERSWGTVTRFNDARDHDDVLAMFDRAISRELHREAER